ncbi:MAG: response regulator transcription factor [Elusimicrobia bacterium]|nr:response regulator transcription factor [Elusimicrobiota bacterium]
MARRIIVAHRDEETGKVLCAHLKARGSETAWAHDAISLSQRFQAGADLLVLDSRLPGATGAALVERLRGNTHTADLPIIILTDLSADAARAELPGASRVKFLQNPVELSFLDALIEGFLGEGPRAARDAVYREPDDSDQEPPTVLDLDAAP